MQNNKILPQIKFQYYQSTNEAGERPKQKNATCSECGRHDITIGGGRVLSDGSQAIVCEDCVIDEYQKKNKFNSRAAAEARRRRMFDVSYLFNEMITDKYIEMAGLENIDNINEEEMRMVMEKGKYYYNTLFSKRGKIKLEETEDQLEIERVLRGKLSYVKLENLREKISVEFSRGQYEKLIGLAYAGNYLINGVRDGSADNPRIEEYENLENYIYAQAEKFGINDLVEYDKKSQRYFPTCKLEEGELSDYIDDYDEQNFFEELVSRFENRDFRCQYGQETIEKMGWKERIEKRQEFYEKYFDEFQEHDIERLEIKE